MLGFMFNLAWETTAGRLGEKETRRIWEEAGLLPSYEPHVDYDDDDFVRLIKRLAIARGRTYPTMLMTSGCYTLDSLVRQNPEFLLKATDSISFLKYVETDVHRAMQDRYSQGRLPTFTFEDLPDGRTRVTYSSERDLHLFFEGMVVAVGKYYNEHITITRPELDLPPGSTAFDLLVEPKSIFPSYGTLEVDRVRTSADAEV